MQQPCCGEHSRFLAALWRCILGGRPDGREQLAAFGDVSHPVGAAAWGLRVDYRDRKALITGYFVGFGLSFDFPFHWLQLQTELSL